MSAVLGGMEIHLMADLARLRRDMGDAVNIVRGAGRSIEQVLGRVGVGLSIGAVVMWTKSVIDAAGAAVDMAQKVGMSVEDVTALGVVFQQSGVSAEAFKTGIVQMSKSVADNAAAYKALGIATADAAGNNREAKAVLMDLADGFKALPDGMLKTKLATELLGKAGADMIPALNQGGAAMRAAADEAKAMGAAMTTEAAQAADEFGDALDVLKAKAQATTLNGLSDMLPVLTEVARQLALTGKEANQAGKDAGFWEEAFATAAEAVGVLVLNVSYVFRSMAGEAGAILRQIKALATANLDEAGRIADDWTARAAAMRVEVDKQSAAILGARERHKQTAEAMKAGADAAALSAAENRRLGLDTTAAATAMARAAIAAKETEAAHKRAAEEAKRLAEQKQKLRDAGAALVQQTADELAAERMQLEMGRKLTEAERDYIKIAIQVRDGKVLLTDAQLRDAWSKLQARDAAKALNAAEEDLAKTMAAVAAHSSKLAGEEAGHTATLRDSVLQMREQNERMRIGDEAFDRRQAKLVREQAAELEWQAAMQGGSYQLTEQARLLRERATLMEEGAALKEAKATADEWKRTTQEISAGMTDALMRGFESGKSAWVVLRNYLINSAKTMVLRPLVEFGFSSMAQQMSPWLMAFRSVLGGAGLGGAGQSGGVDPEGINQLGKTGGGSAGTLGSAGLGKTLGAARVPTLPSRLAAPGSSSGKSEIHLTQHLTINVDAAADQARLSQIAQRAVRQGNQEMAKELKAMGALQS